MTQNANIYRSEYYLHMAREIGDWYFLHIISSVCFSMLIVTPCDNERQQQQWMDDLN